MYAISILGQSKRFHSLALAKQDARREVLDSVMQWIETEYHHVSSGDAWSASGHQSVLVKQRKVLIASMLRKLAKEQWSIEEGKFVSGSRFRCFVVINLGEAELNQLVQAYGIVASPYVRGRRAMG